MQASERELLIRIDERTQRMDQAIFGTPVQPGMIARVERLERCEPEKLGARVSQLEKNETRFKAVWTGIVATITAISEFILHRGAHHIR